MNIVFDIGNVLVKWDLERAFIAQLGSEAAVRGFLIRTDFLARNLRADKGERFADLATEIPEPGDAALMAGYPARMGLTIQHRISGTWDVMAGLRAKGHRIHAITNWSAETWPHALTLHPELEEAFEVTIVSGREGMIKPDAAIFGLLCDRAGAVPEDCLFIDDSPKNVAGAEAAGMQAIHFTSPQALDAGLRDRGLL